MLSIQFEPLWFRVKERLNMHQEELGFSFRAHRTSGIEFISKNIDPAPMNRKVFLLNMPLYFCGTIVRLSGWILFWHHAPFPSVAAYFWLALHSSQGTQTISGSNFSFSFSLAFIFVAFNLKLFDGTKEMNDILNVAIIFLFQSP